ncbi:MAG: rod shape-determining protein MreC [Lutibacter sp.]|jgi:rod shape-determining protein MreC|nr:rod shape-determining protein MreC [Lutibacter sp.]MDP3947021.1 rod shape-determining protein MreC [Lutibacter sp.]
MRQIIYFIKKFRYFLLFIVLEILAFIVIVQDHSYHQSKFVNSANAITGGVYNKVNSVSAFFHLKKDNQLLSEENVRLKNLLEARANKFVLDSFTVIDTSQYFQKYDYSTAKIINNNFTKRNNFLTINKGAKHGLAPDLGVINSKGIIGVIKNVSSNYASVLSILNTNSKINVRLKNSNHFGTLVWDGKDYNITQIIDIPRQAVVKTGDTIITGGKSAIFPEGIAVGVVKDFNYEQNKYQIINIVLFNDMSAIGEVQIVKNLHKNEQIILEQSVVNE